MKELKMIMNDDGVFEEYDDTYDLTIHCTSQEEQDEVLLRLNKTVENAGRDKTGNETAGKR